LTRDKSDLLRLRGVSEKVIFACEPHEELNEKEQNQGKRLWFCSFGSFTRDAAA